MATMVAVGMVKSRRTEIMFQKNQELVREGLRGLGWERVWEMKGPMVVCCALH